MAGCWMQVKETRRNVSFSVDFSSVEYFYLNTQSYVPEASCVGCSLTSDYLITINRLAFFSLWLTLSEWSGLVQFSLAHAPPQGWLQRFLSSPSSAPVTSGLDHVLALWQIQPGPFTLSPLPAQNVTGSGTCRQRQTPPHVQTSAISVMALQGLSSIPEFAAGGQQ